MNSRKPKSAPPLLIPGNALCRADLRYAVDFACPDAVWLLVTGRERILAVSDLEYGRARRQSSATGVWTPAQLGLAGTAAQRLDHWALALLRRFQLRRVRVPGSFPLRTARFLEQHGILLETLKKPPFPTRAVKREDEIKHIRRAQRTAVRAMRSAFACLRAAQTEQHGVLYFEGRPLSAERLRHRIQSVLIEGDCLAEEIIVACGSQAADPHQRGTGRLRAGQTIVIDIFPREQRAGYWGDLTRTVIKGTPTAFQRRLFLAVRDAQRAALACVRAGVPCARVHRSARAVLDARGFVTETREGAPMGFIHATGHGVGLDIHEAPRLSATATDRLKSGQVITIEPGWYDPAVGGVRIEDTVVVTPTGHQRLAFCPMPLCIP